LAEKAHAHIHIVKSTFQALTTFGRDNLSPQPAELELTLHSQLTASLLAPLISIMHYH